jgi:hypothetical protein
LRSLLHTVGSLEIDENVQELKYVSSNLGFGRQNRTTILASTCFAFEQLILNQLLNVLAKALKIEMKRFTTAIPKAR